MKRTSLDQFNGQELHANMLSNEGSAINFAAATTPVAMIAALKQFNAQVVQAKNAGILDQEMATDAQHHITHVIAQVSRPTTNRVFIMQHLTAAVSCLATVSVLGLVLYDALEAFAKFLA